MVKFISYQHILKLLWLVAVLIFLTVARPIFVYADMPKSCRAVFELPEVSIEHVSRAFSEAWYNEEVYCIGKCHQNVIRLYSILKSKVPNISIDEINVIYIKRAVDYEYEDSGFHVIGSRGMKKNEVLAWRFHVVLEYRGNILDLDRSQPKIYLKSKYLKGFFIDWYIKLWHPAVTGFPSELVAYRIPGSHYLREDLMEYLKLNINRRAFLEQYQPQPLKQFMQD